MTFRTKDGTLIARDAVPDFKSLLTASQLSIRIDAMNRARQARAGYPGWGKLGGAIQRATDLYYDDGIIPFALHDGEAPWDRT